MVQIVPRSNFLGESFEKNFGQMGANMAEGISSGLTALANMKLQQMQQRHQQNRFQPLLEKAGYSPEIAALISSYDQPQQTALMNMLGLPGGMFSQQQSQTNPQLQQIASLLGTNPTPEAINPVLQGELQKRMQAQFGAQPPQQAYQNQLMATAMGQQINPYTDIMRTLNPAQIQQLSTQMAEAGMNPQGMQQQMQQPIGQMIPQMQGQPIEQAPQAAETPESLREMANYIEQRGGSRYKNKVADLRKRARDMENAQRRQAERAAKPKKLTDDDRQRFYMEASKTEKNTAKAIELAKKLALEAGYRE